MKRHDTLTSTVHVDSPASGGAVGIVEIAVPPRWDGPPLHHHAFDEAFHVLAGELTFQLDDDITTAGPGATVFAARDRVHTLANLSDAPARYLLICTPGGFERLFSRLAAKAAGEEPSAEAQKDWPETIFVGPTLMERLG